MSRLRKKSTITMMILISICAVLVFNHYTTMVLAWDDEELTAPLGNIPIIDGKEESAWDKSNVTHYENPDLDLKVMINSSFLFVMVEVKSNTHSDDEYVKFLISNVTSEPDDDDFIDAKLIQTRNFTNAENRTFFIEDQNYNASSGEYVVDTEENFEGAANTSIVDPHSYYEFKLDFKSKNNDTVNDIGIVLEESYAITVEFGSHVEGGEADPNDIDGFVILLFHVDPIDDPTGDPLNLKVVAYIVFSVVGVAFAVIIVVSYQSRKKI